MLFSDFKGFTGFSSLLDSDTLVAELDHFFRLFDQLGERHRVEKIKTIGDAYMCATGLPEPDPQHCALVDPQTCECILIPGVGFDRQGFRLGFGGGYYDRLLARVGPKTRTIGLAYDYQILDALPRDTHDQSVQVVCTDKEVIWARE